MACLGLPDIQRIARDGVAAVAGAAEHLASCNACSAALGSHIREHRSTAGVVQLGRYQILDERGRGAFGRVFEAFDPALDRRVAIKLLALLTPSSPAALAELLREAKAMAQIQHPNVIPIFDVGRTDDGVFLTMPLVDGETLAAWSARQRATGNDPERAITSVIGKVAAGLAAIHVAGFVHRDLKPNNILIAGTNVWIADLGLARRTSNRPTKSTDATVVEGELTASTHTASLAGTPAYMAPECLSGEAASPKSDQYALAVTCVEILTGHRPFRAPTYLGLLAAARSEAPRLEGVPPRFRAALTLALHPRPEQRFPTVAAFATALLAKPRARRARYLLLAVIPALAIVGWRWLGSTEARLPVAPPPVTVTPIQVPVTLSVPPTSVVPDAPLRARVPCRDRCMADHEAATGRCNQSEASCEATVTSAFAGCGDALDVASCERLRSQFVQSCTHHQVTIDPTCAPRARTCVAACAASECESPASSPPMSAESCRSTLVACQATAAAKLPPLEEARRRGWDECAAANTTCRAGAPGASCGEDLRRCNTRVAAQFEQGKELVDHEDHGCLISQTACFAGSSGGTGSCTKSAAACSASCARTQYSCLAKPVPATTCSTGADTTFATCLKTCKP